MANPSTLVTVSYYSLDHEDASNHGKEYTFGSKGFHSTLISHCFPRMLQWSCRIHSSAAASVRATFGESARNGRQASS